MYDRNLKWATSHKLNSECKKEELYKPTVYRTGPILCPLCPMQGCPYELQETRMLFVCILSTCNCFSEHTCAKITFFEKF